MKSALVIAALVAAFASTAALAQSRPFETIDEARWRQSAERYDTYQSRGYQAPLGGYSERLGDPAPRETLSPGYVPPPTYNPRPTIDYQGAGRAWTPPSNNPLGLETVGPQPLGR